MKTVSITFVITREQEKMLRQLHREYEDNHNERVSVSEYIRRTLFPQDDSPNPSSIPTSEQQSEPSSKYSFNLDDL